MVNLEKFIDKDLIGYFWLPNKEEEKFQGHFKFNDNQILITLNGGFPWQNYTITESGAKRKDFNTFEIFDVICGEVEGLGKITIFDAYERTKNMNWVKNSPLFEKQIISSEDFFIGDNFNSKEDISFDKVSFLIEEVNYWAYNISGFKQDYVIDGSEFKEFKLNYSFPQKEEFNIHTINRLLTIEANFKPSNSRNGKENNLNENLILNLSNEDSLFYDLLADIYTIKNLLSLFINDNINIQSIILKRYNPDSEKYLKYCQFFMKKSYSKKNKDKFEYEMFILFPEIKENFEKILDNWFTFSKENSHILEELFMSLNNPGGMITNFLSYAKILEAIHRNIDDSSPFKKEKIKEINKNIKSEILKNEDDKIKEKYLQRFSEVNNYNLQERLDFLFKKTLSDDIKLELKLNDSFTKRVKEMRNDLTHLNKKLEDINFDELYSMVRKLKFIIYVIIFRQIQISEETLLNRLKDNWVKKYYL